MCAASGASADASMAAVRVTTDAPCVQWAADKLKAALRLCDRDALADVPVIVSIAVDPRNLLEAARKPEGFYLSRTGREIRVTGYDPPGTMYGCLELARRIRDEKGLPAALDAAESPSMSLRGTCILLMKLGLYDYPVTPQEFPFFYNRALWIEYLDFLAENRFNFIAFWNGHPFDYFVKLDRYPEAQDGLEPGLLERNHDTLMWLGEEAAKRNIWLMFQFYNIHVSVYFARAHQLPKHGISTPTPLLREYTAYCIERFVSEFPNVGLYICPGEALQLKYTPEWINEVIFDAVKRTGKTPPIMIRSWGIDLEHMKQVAGRYPRLYSERKFNVEMIADTRIDPENKDWAALTGNHVVNIHCLGNLEPFRWSPPSYIRECVRNSVAAGATGLHLYPRKAWRWPYGCDKGAESELQWRRDWMWFEAWGRYAWNPGREPAEEQAFWRARLARHFGEAAALPVLDAIEYVADVLPSIQRLVWLGNDNHTIVTAGILLEQLQTAKGIPFLDMPDTMRIPEYIQACAQKRETEDKSPVEFLAKRVADAGRALDEAQDAVKLATKNKAEAERLAGDVRAQALTVHFYWRKLQAAVAEALARADIDVQRNAAECLIHLKASLDDFRALVELTSQTYESLSDVPAWNPTKDLPCPYHWAQILPLFEQEYAQIREGFTGRFPDIAAQYPK